VLLLNISVARVHAEFHPGITKSGQLGRLFRRHVHCHNRSLHLLRYLFPLCLSLTPLTVMPRDSNRAAGGLRGPLRARAVPSRPVLARNSGRCGALDRVHIDRLLSTRAQPCQLTDAQLCARRCRCRRRVLAWLLDRLGAQVVCWAHQADHPR
jgi:hypothetical protein